MQSVVSKIAEIVRDAGGKVVGRTNLQKIAYLLEITGYGTGFRFRYKSFGPYCDELAEWARSCVLQGGMSETEETTPWGGVYSIYEVDEAIPEKVPEGRLELASQAAEAGTIVLELATTAVYLHLEENYKDPWLETKSRKPVKSAEGRLEKAGLLLADLRKIKVPNPLPEF